MVGETRRPVLAGRPSSSEGDDVRKRKLGRTGLEVSEISFGAWQLGNDDDWAGMDDATALALVHEALEQGVNLFDTAPNYAATNSERLLGEALRGRRDQVVLVSKFGHPPDGPKDFSVARFRTSLDESLRRLRTDHLDVLLLHNPPAAMYGGGDPLWDELEKARREGRIRRYGASLDFAAEAEACLANTGSEVCEVLFNIFHQDIRRAFPLFRRRQTGVIVKVPLDSGWLTGRFGTGTGFDGVRARWTREQVEQRAALVARLSWLTADGAPLARQALAYVLSYDEVSCAIPGVRSRAQLLDNVAAAGRTLPDADRRRLEELWDEATGGGAELLPW
jgi:aryl-alcohol dehydrogenase-like predicted oxidoreductase